MHKQAGTSLIEILVTILIVSFGLLGVAGVVGSGLKNNHSSYGRTQASVLAADIIDRMRANRAVAESADPSPYSLPIEDPPGVSIVQQDLFAWSAALAETLPTGTGSVSFDAATKKMTVTVQWDDSRGTGGTGTQTFVVETRL